MKRNFRKLLIRPEKKKERREGNEKDKNHDFYLGIFFSFPVDHNRNGGRLSAKTDPHDHSLECGGMK